MADHQLVVFDYVIPATNEADSVYLDASLNENHVASAEVTQHQVETGPNIVDYIRPIPRKLTISGIATNTPIGTSVAASVVSARQAAGISTVSETDQQAGQLQKNQITIGGQPVSYSALTFSTEFDRVRAVYGSLVKAALAGALFRVVTALTVYQSPQGTSGPFGGRIMAITNFAVPQSAASGGSIRFAIDFMEVRLVDTQATSIPVVQAKKKRGQKPPHDLDPKKDEKKQSVLHKSLH
jgi:effector-binding domain-containing protein